MASEIQKHMVASTSTLPARRSLLAGELPALDELVDAMGISRFRHGNASLTGSDPVIHSPHKLGEASACAQLAIGLAASAVWASRTGVTTDVSIGIIDALHFLHPTHYVQQQGRSINVGAEHVATNNLYACRDGRYVMLEAGPPYPKLLDGYLNFFNCGNNREALSEAVSRWDAEALETALSKAGLPACRAFTRDEWLAHPQGKTLAQTPVVEIEKIADGSAVPFSVGRATSPLAGIRVLDFTHVLAGPRSARTLAEHGADVLHVSAPAYPDTFAQHLGVDVGKRCTYLDLRDAPDLQRMHRLAAESDVFTSTYRHSVNERFALLPHQLAATHPRGIVCMTANAYGHEGPWATRPGFDQNGQVASGFAAAEGSPGEPRFSPVFYLADLITGYLAAAGIMTALLRRATEGGSYHVKLSLARSAMWVQELGLLEPNDQIGLPRSDIYPADLVRYPSVYGEIAWLRQPLSYTALELPEVSYIEPYGASQPTWW